MAKIDEYKLRMAKKALAGVKRALKGVDIPNDVLVLETYKNGRENGYAISVFPHGSAGIYTIAFAENRSSDDLVVHAGNNRDFSYGSNVPHEELYKERRYFDPDQQDEAVAYIVKKVIEFANRKRESKPLVTRKKVA